MQADYCIKVDREWSIDGRDRATDTTKFSPCHMNHSGSRQNVVRSTKRRQRKISFFAKTDIEVNYLAPEQAQTKLTANANKQHTAFTGS